MLLANVSGIYKITNMKNKKIYIGSSLYIRIRCIHHKNELNLNRHYNKHLQRAWNKYGEKNFKFSIVEKTTKRKTTLENRETFWIQKYKSNKGTKGYNVGDTARNNGATWTWTKSALKRHAPHRKAAMNRPEVKLKISLANRKRFKENPESFKNGGPKFLTKEQRLKISKALTGSKRTEQQKENMRKAQQKIAKNRVYTKDLLDRMAIAKGGKPFKVYDIKGKLIGKFINQNDCARKLDIHNTQICMCLKGKVKSANGFTFRYL